MKSNKGFTLIEMLVVVLIIGILAAIAVPQYQKAVMKAELHKGIPLVESLYQAQQAYFLANGEFAQNLDILDVSVPKDDNCTKTQSAAISSYTCDFGRIGLVDSFSNVQFLTKNKQIAYLHYLTDFKGNDLERKAGEVWCFANPDNKQAQDVCEQLGGVYQEANNNSWLRYKIR